MRSSPLLGDLMFHLSLEDISSVQKCQNERYMFQMLKQAAQGPQPILHEASKAQGSSKQASFRAPSTSQVSKPRLRLAEVPSTQPTHHQPQPSRRTSQQGSGDFKRCAKHKGVYNPKQM